MNGGGTTEEPRRNRGETAEKGRQTAEERQMNGGQTADKQRIMPDKQQMVGRQTDKGTDRGQLLDGYRLDAGQTLFRRRMDVKDVGQTHNITGERSSKDY